MRNLPAIILLILIVTSCGGDEAKTLSLEVDPETTPTMLTHDVSTLISDSGVIRYHITAPIWYVYGEASQPRWSFPDGLFVEKYDNAMKRDATIECDSATYFEKQRLWRLDGNVKIMNTANERFLTQQLFWDQRRQSVYSDSFIHIERQDRIIEGYGFTSNDRLTEYEVNRVSGIFPVSQFTRQQDASADQTNSIDSASVAPGPATSDKSSGPSSINPDSVNARHRRAMRPRRLPRHNQADTIVSDSESITQ